MSDDFVRLVSTANPAARYQPANGGNYPPSTSYAQSNSHSGQALDPFFDDEDDMPDSAFGRPAPMQSMDSGLPLSSAAARPAGTGPSTTTLNDSAAKTWTFDDDEPSHPGSVPYTGSAAFPGAPTPTERGVTTPKRRKWKWPWEKEQELTGERVIALNNSAANTEFPSNYVSTSKYNIATFLPKFMFGACDS
jgi:phospholipid-transporting ATPase